MHVDIDKLQRERIDVNNSLARVNPELILEWSENIFLILDKIIITQVN